MAPVVDHRHRQDEAAPRADVPNTTSAEPAPEPGLVAVPGLHQVATPLRRQQDPLGGSEVSGAVAAELLRRRGGGSALPDALSAPLGQHFGMDLSDVRVHTDSGAGALARSIDAAAFTHGNDIFFAPGAYRPGSSDGQRMLAHELGHVAAQRSGADAGAAGSLRVGRADDPAEAAADRAADRAMTALRRTLASGADVAAAVGTAAVTRPAAADEPEIRRWKWPWEKSGSKGGKVPAPDVTVPVNLTAPSTGTTTGGDATPSSTVAEDTKTTGGTSETTTTESKAAEVEYPRVATVGTEQVTVANKSEEDEANRIATELKDLYGLDLSSAATIAGIKRQYTNVPSEVTNKLAATTWTIRELRALSEAASYYAPILGSKRDESTLAGSVQGVTTIGKLRNAIDTNKATGELDSTTLGEYFSGSKNLGLFSAGSEYQDKNFVRKGQKKTDVQTSLTATSIHEMAHALVAPTELGNWVSGLSYWKDRYTASGKWRTEKPPTSYGKTNANEDLCESVALYFINKETLKKKCPLRFALVDKIVKGWTPETKTAAVDTAVSSPGTEATQPGAEQK